MTVRELIEALQRFDPDAEVRVTYEGCVVHLTEVDTMAGDIRRQPDGTTCWRPQERWVGGVWGPDPDRRPEVIVRADVDAALLWA